MYPFENRDFRNNKLRKMNHLSEFLFALLLLLSIKTFVVQMKPIENKSNIIEAISDTRKFYEQFTICNISENLSNCSCMPALLFNPKYLPLLNQSNDFKSIFKSNMLCFKFHPLNKASYQDQKSQICLTLLDKNVNMSSQRESLPLPFKSYDKFYIKETKCPPKFHCSNKISSQKSLENIKCAVIPDVPKKDSLNQKIAFSSIYKSKYRSFVHYRNAISKDDMKNVEKKPENRMSPRDIYIKRWKIFDVFKTSAPLKTSARSSDTKEGASQQNIWNYFKRTDKRFGGNSILERLKRSVEFPEDNLILKSSEENKKITCNGLKNCLNTNLKKLTIKRELDMIKVEKNDTDYLISNDTDYSIESKNDLFAANINATLKLLNENMTDTFSIFQNMSKGINPFLKRGENKKIYLLGFFELNSSDCKDHSKLGLYEYKAVDYAIRLINEKKIIDGYQLEMYYNDTRCDSGVAVDSFFHSLYKQPTISAILGPGSSEVTERLARIVSRWNIVQMSYGATSPALSDRKNFPMFFRTVAPDSSHNAALLAFILHHKWSTVAVIHEQGDKHALPMTKLVTGLEQANVTVSVTKETNVKDYKDHLQDIKNQDCRIIISSFSSALFWKVFCEVYYLEMHGAEYAWLIIGDKPESWWDDAWDTECNSHQLSEAVQGIISIGNHYEAIGNGTSVSEMTMPEILQEIGLDAPNRSSGFVAQAYDAVWAIALALRNVEQYWRTTNSSLTLGDFTYDNQEMASKIAKTLAGIRFMGVSGPVSFYNADRVGITAFHQRQGDDLKLVTIYNPDDAQLDFECLGCSDIIWQGGSPPISSRNIIMRIAVLDQRVFICVTALAVFGVTLALTFLSFNLYYRKMKFIKLSSPNLNNFVIVGCILVYIAVILLGMDYGTLFSDSHFHIVCSARAFLLSGGFSLAFGCMFIKTYRVYHIFIRANTGIVKSKLLHDRQLLGLVSLLLLLDCVLVTLWVIIDPMERQLTNLSMQVNNDERNVVYLYLREHCSSSHMAKWLGSLYIYKGLLLVVGCYMAWETRHVKVPALNDSQYIGMSVYNVVITSIIVVALANVIPAERYTLTYVLVSTLIFVSTTTTLCILFVPKIHTIFINPEDAGVVATPGVKVECKTRRFALDEPRESIYRAEILNRALKRELLELDEEYNKLAAKLGITQCAVRRLTIEEEESLDDDSDDGLPPWIAEYKDYSSTGNGEVWTTNQPTIASAFNAIHHVALHLPSTSTGFRGNSIDTCKTGYLKNKSATTSFRASLTKIDNQKEVPMVCSKAVRRFLSDRALNKIRIRQTLRETKFDDKNGSPIPLRNILLSAAQEKLRSEPKLYYEFVPQCNMAMPQCVTRSLNHVACFDNSQSDFSKCTTSGASCWTTAPLHDSTSFSTPPEDFFSSSNNGNSSSKSGVKSSEKFDNNNTTSIYISCEDENTSMSTQGSSGTQSSRGNQTGENCKCYPQPSCSYSTYRQLPTEHGSTSSSNSSIYGATMSDHSVDMNDEGSKIPEDSNGSRDAGNSYFARELGASVVRKKKPEFCLTHTSKISSAHSRKQKADEIVINIPQENTVTAAANNKTNETRGEADLTMNFPNAEPTQNLNNSDVNSNAYLSSDETNSVIARMNNLRHQIFRLERELILLQLEQSEAIDL